MPTLTFLLDDRHSIDYDLIDSPIAEIVAEIIKDRQIEIYNSWSEGGADAAALISELDRTAAALGLETRDLNQLHLAFENAHNSGDRNPQWEQINRLVHAIENHQKPRVLGVHLLSDPVYEPVAINDQLRPYWAYTPRSGDCCLGYATIGKDLMQAATTDDHQLVRAQKLAPQTEIRLEFLLFSQDPPVLPTGRQVHQRIYRWAQRRGVEQFVDWNRAENRCHGRPLIARIKDPRQLASVTSGSKIHSVRLTV
jgi:hypothetical protein